MPSPDGEVRHKNKDRNKDKNKDKDQQAGQRARPVHNSAYFHRLHLVSALVAYAWSPGMVATTL